MKRLLILFFLVVSYGYIQGSQERSKAKDGDLRGFDDRGNPIVYVVDGYYNLGEISEELQNQQKELVAKSARLLADKSWCMKDLNLLRGVFNTPKSLNDQLFLRHMQLSYTHEHGKVNPILAEVLDPKSPKIQIKQRIADLKHSLLITDQQLAEVKTRLTRLDIAYQALNKTIEYHKQSRLADNKAH